MNTINQSNVHSRTLLSDTTANNSVAPLSEKKSMATAAPVISVYDIYGIKEGFSNNLSNADKVTLSPVGLMLSEAQSLAESQRETWNDPSKIFENEVNFSGVFKEVQSEDGGLIFRKFNSSYLDQIQSAPDALLLYEQINKQDKTGIVVTSTSDLDQIVFKLRAIAAQDRYNSIVDLANKTFEVSEATKNFSSILAKEYPDLEGIELEFSTKGDEIIVSDAKQNAIELSPQERLKIENLINGKHETVLKQSLFSLREASIEYYNRYTDSGRDNPITNADFDQRFGGFNNYLNSFGSRDGSQLNGSYNGLTSYFSDAANSISLKLNS